MTTHAAPPDVREAAAAGLGGVGGEGRLPPAEVRRVLVEVADALAYAHAQGVLHRDLKPENVLLERAPGMDDDPPRVRLIDFGVAAFRTRDLGAGARGEMWGTAEFMAPEQAFGEPERDPRSDLYALGVLGYLTLGGRLPFDATSPAKRLLRQEAGPRQRLGAIAPGAAPDLVAAIERCLAYDPAARWPRARDLRDALARGAAHDAVLAEDAPLAERLREVGRVRGAARRARAAAVAMRDAVLAGGLAADLRFAVRTFRKTPGVTAALAPDLALHRATPVSQDLELWRVPQRMGVLVVGLFGVTGLAVAVTGLYGVLAYTVAGRRREFGVRLALGAPPRSIVRLVMRDGLALTGVGVALGLGAALVAGRLVSGFLYGVSPADPLTFGVVPVLLGATAVVASAIPARRAACADPTAALRAD